MMDFMSTILVFYILANTQDFSIKRQRNLTFFLLYATIIYRNSEKFLKEGVKMLEELFEIKEILDSLKVEGVQGVAVEMVKEKISGLISEAMEEYDKKFAVEFQELTGMTPREALEEIEEEKHQKAIQVFIDKTGFRFSLKRPDGTYEELIETITPQEAPPSGLH